MNWTFNGEKIVNHSCLPIECVAIVYVIRYDDGLNYIGQKVVRSERRLKPTKAQLAIRKNYKRVEVKDLPFKDYTGSSKENAGRTIVSKEILAMTSNKRTASYIETKLLMKYGAIESNDKFSNQNISGRYFDNCLDGLIFYSTELKENEW